MPKRAVISVWAVRGMTYDFHVKIKGLSGYDRKAPYKFYIRGNKIVTEEKKYFGVLYGQICYLVRESFRRQEKVSQIIRKSSSGQRKKGRKKIPKDAYLHQLRCQEAGACD